MLDMEHTDAEAIVKRCPHPEEVPEGTYLSPPTVNLNFLVGGANLATASLVRVVERRDVSVVDAPVVAASLGPVHRSAANLDWPFHLVEEGREVMAVSARPPAALC